MALLSDDPVPSRRSGGGFGEKFLNIYRGLDAEDQAKVRRWHDEGRGYTFIHHKIAEHFDIGYTSVERGIWRLVESQWEC